MSHLFDHSDSVTVTNDTIATLKEDSLQHHHDHPMVMASNDNISKVITKKGGTYKKV